MKFIKSLLILILISTALSAQNGFLLLIGGGSENITSTTSWNYEAFNWAVEKSANKKVAILHYSTTPDSDFEDYFINHCGASAVKSFVVNATTANSAVLVNEISEYDVFYMRGGDQWNYYSNWRGKLIEDALHSKYKNGGVICGTSAGLAIMSGVLFTAEYNSAYSNLCIKNTNHVTITLENNFLEFMPGLIFDSHFTNRGRLGRLLSFMANWKNYYDEEIVGIGVDEITALAIDSSKVATAYGAGTVDIIRFDDNTVFTQGGILDVKDFQFTKLVQGTSINLNDFSVSGYNNKISAFRAVENTPSIIYASGGDDLNETNEALLHEFINDGGVKENILILTGSKTGISNDFKNKLEELGAENVSNYAANNITSSDAGLAQSIRNTSRFIFVDNNTYDFMSLFLETGGEASLELLNAFENRSLQLAFIGDNARFIGTTIIGNYIGSYANASLSEGLKILKNTVIIPKTYALGNDGYTTLWHATNASLPYAMVKDGIPNGIWLNKDNYVVFSGINDSLNMQVHGISPVGLLCNENSFGSFVTQTYSGSGSPDKKAGFDHMSLSYIAPDKRVNISAYESFLSVPFRYSNNSICVFPNPASQNIHIQSEFELSSVSIYNLLGTKVYNTSSNNKKDETIELSNLDLVPGYYLLEIIDIENKKRVQQILIK